MAILDGSVGDWVGEITTTTGTGDIALGGALEGYASFETITLDATSTVWYTIVDGNNRELGRGNLDGNTLERTNIYSTLVNGVYSEDENPINLSGSAEVYCTANSLTYEEIKGFLQALEAIDVSGFDDRITQNENDISDHEDRITDLESESPGGSNTSSMPEVTFEANRAQIDEHMAASGVVHTGQHTGEHVNQGLSIDTATANVLYLGADSASDGVSKTTFAVNAIAGIISTLVGNQRAGYGWEVKLPQAPDGTVTYNTSTGEIIKHSDSSTAFAAETADVEVVTERSDIWGFEQFLRKIENTPKGKHVFPKGLIQSQSDDINGITTTIVPIGDIPDTYFAVFHYTASDGTVIETDTSSRGKSVDWFALSVSDQYMILSDPENKIYQGADGELYVHEIRQRTIPGSGNGDWTGLESNSETQLTWDSSLDSTRVKAQGYDSVVTPTFESSVQQYLSSLNTVDNAYDEDRSQQDLALWYLRNDVSNDGLSIDGQCYFISLGTVTRLSQGAYHPSFCPLGAAKFSDDKAWWETAVSKASTEDCFVSPVGGDITTGNSGREDGFFFDAIYPGGQGGVIDYRLSSYDASQIEFAGTIEQQLQANEYRGKQKLPRVSYIVNSSSTFLSSTPYAVRIPSFGSDLNTLPLTGSEYEPADGYVTIDGTQHQVMSYLRESAGSDIFLSSVTMDPAGEASGQSITDCVVWVLSGVSVSGDFTNETIVSAVSVIILSDDLKGGWLGDWCPLTPNGTTMDFPLQRKNLDSDSIEILSNNGGVSWSSAIRGIDVVINSRNTSASNNSIRVFSYRAASYFTVIADNTEILHKFRSLHSVYLSADHKPEEGCILAESLIKKVLTSDADEARSIQRTLLDKGRILSDGTLSDTIETLPSHNAVDAAKPTNDGAGIKSMVSQLNVNGQLTLQIHGKEMFYDNTADGEGDAIVVSTSASFSYSNSEFYQFDDPAFGNYDQMFVVAAKSLNTTAANISTYILIDDDLVFAGNGQVQFHVWQGESSGWGDDGLINVTDGEAPSEDENGNSIRIVCHRLSIPAGWVKNEV